MAAKKKPLPNQGYRRFEYSDGKRSNKYWEIKVGSTHYDVRYGAIGTQGRRSNGYGSGEALIRSKIRKGYVEVTFT